MPYYNPDTYVYEAAGGALRVDALRGYARYTYDALRALGVTGIGGGFDGGHDELFTNVDRVRRGGEWEWVFTPPAWLAQSPLGTVPTSLDEPGWESYVDWLRNETPEKRVESALGALGADIAEQMGVFGVGEMTVRGGFLADFETGELKDLKDEDL